jgi:hypothetical protein
MRVYTKKSTTFWSTCQKWAAKNNHLTSNYTCTSQEVRHFGARAKN